MAETVLWATGPALLGGVGVVVSAQMKGWMVEIMRRKDGQFDLFIDGQRSNWDGVPTLEDAYELGRVVHAKLREKKA